MPSPKAKKSAETRRKKFFSNIKSAVNQSRTKDAPNNKLSDQNEAYKNFTYQPEEKSHQQQLAQFKEILATQSAEIYECDEPDLIETLEKILKDKPYGRDVLIGKNTGLNQRKASLNSAINFIEVESFEKNTENYNVTCTLTTAFAAASETGTLFLSSSIKNPTWLNYLATAHIIVLDKSTLCQTYEQAFAIGQNKAEATQESYPPRSLNMISGPSRTADIEQTLTLGAHGPIELIVLIYRSVSQE